MPYLLDANIFIQAKNLHYGFDFCPAFWEWLEQKHTEGIVFSVEKVKDELEAMKDELTEWARTIKEEFFQKVTPVALLALGKVSEWAYAQEYEPSAVNGFFQVADYYLVGQALALGYTVVTHEVPANSVKRVKIPNVCIGMEIKCITPYEMLRKERARFILGPSQ